MDDKIKFSPNVILLDVTFLNELVSNARTFLSVRLGRELPDVDLPSWLTYLALDAGLREGDNEIQVLLVHDEATRKMKCCLPAELESLNGMACRTPLGEFIFSCVTTAQITDCEHLFLDLQTLAMDSADVQCLMLVPYHPRYGEQVEEELRKCLKEKSGEERLKAVYFTMSQPEKPLPCRWDYVIYSLAKAFGISADEMN